jgi:hypothetical protein
VQDVELETGKGYTIKVEIQVPYRACPNSITPTFDIPQSLGTKSTRKDLQARHISPTHQIHPYAKNQLNLPLRYITHQPFPLNLPLSIPVFSNTIFILLSIKE